VHRYKHRPWQMQLVVGRRKAEFPLQSLGSLNLSWRLVVIPFFVRNIN